MYQSPIEIISKEIRTTFENNVYQAIQDVGINVNKGELIRALQYDRDQYDKGYNDGYRDALAKINQILEEPLDDV